MQKLNIKKLPRPHGRVLSRVWNGGRGRKDLPLFRTDTELSKGDTKTTLAYDHQESKESTSIIYFVHSCRAMLLPTFPSKTRKQCHLFGKISEHRDAQRQQYAELVSSGNTSRCSFASKKKDSRKQKTRPKKAAW